MLNHEPGEWLSEKESPYGISTARAVPTRRGF
nr:MAG TPA: hypothetical protein [Herelleviridae sp.]